MSLTLSEMINWPPHDSIVIVDDSEDDVPQRKERATDDCVAANIGHTPLAAAAHHLPPYIIAYQLTDLNTAEGEPAASTLEQTEERAEHLALCQTCQHPRDLMQFYEPIDGEGRMDTSCRACRQRDESATHDSRPTYQCPCGSVLRTTSSKSHRQTKKHKAWIRTGQPQPAA